MRHADATPIIAVDPTCPGLADLAERPTRRDGALAITTGALGAVLALLGALGLA